MHRGYKIVACIPAGRMAMLEPNLALLRTQQGFLDGVLLWVNTDVHHDLVWMEAQRDGFVCPVPLDDREPPLKPKQLNTGRFYKYTTDPDTIYVRFDDDIVWQHPDALRNLVDFRIDHPEFFVVFANIWNNAVCSAIQWQRGTIQLPRGHRISKHCMDPVAWGDGRFAVNIHELLLDRIDAGTTEELFFPSEVLETVDGRPLRFSVGCFAWFGSTWAEFGGELDGYEEESWITGDYPETHDVKNAICGDALVAHYAFFKQRDALAGTGILDRYRVIAYDRLHDEYYRLLGLAESWTPFRVGPWWE